MLPKKQKHEVDPKWSVLSPCHGTSHCLVTVRLIVVGEQDYKLEDWAVIAARGYWMLID